MVRRFLRWIFLIRFLSLDKVWHGTVLIRDGLTVDNHEVYEDNLTDKGDKIDEYPPSGTVCVMETAHNQTERGQKNSKREKTADYVLDGIAPAENHCDYAACNKAEKLKPPELRARGAAVEIAIVDGESAIDSLAECHLSLIHCLVIFMLLIYVVESLRSRKPILCKYTDITTYYQKKSLTLHP